MTFYCNLSTLKPSIPENSMITRTVVNTAIAVAISATAMIGLAANADNEEIVERVKPVGQLIITKDTSQKATDSATKVATTDSAPVTTASNGKATYDTACFACHSTGAAGAPIVGKKDAWTSRISQGKDKLYSNAINGFNAMPAKGGRASLSDEDVKAVVDYMVGKSS